MKLVFWLILAFLVLYVLRNKKNAASKVAGSAQPHARKASPQGRTETMLCCVQCGVYLPESEAHRASDGAVFCSEQHRLQARAD